MSWSAGYFTEEEYIDGYVVEMSPMLLNLNLTIAGFDVGARHRVGVDDGISYLELGFGRGTSINIHAATHDGQFVGTDFNPSHVFMARSNARGGGSNITLLEDSFDELLARFADEKPQFDYIVFHGVFTWVNRAIQDTMLRIIRQTLKPGGVVYNSYNCYPGWSPKAPARHLFSLFVEHSSGSMLDKIPNMLNFFEAFLKTESAYMKSAPQNQKLLEELKKFTTTGKTSYIAHEYLNAAWDCFWFSDIVKRTEEITKCNYACSAKILEHYEDLNISPEGLAFLKGIKNKIFREQLKDFYVNRQFRTDIYQKGHANLNQFEISQKILNTEFVLVKPLSEFKNKIGTPRGEAELARDIYDKVLESLAQKSFAPKAVREIFETTRVPFPQLLNALSILVAQGMCLPCQKYSNKVKKQTDAYNRNLFEQQMFKSSSVFVASPLTGSGIVIPETIQLLIKGYTENRRTQKELSQYVWDIYKPQGRKHVKDGKVLNEDSENIAEIDKMTQDFLNNRLPIYKQLGIC